MVPDDSLSGEVETLVKNVLSPLFFARKFRMTRYPGKLKHWPLWRVSMR